MWQGCPLAPFLFLLVAEAMSIHLLGTSTGIKGISLLTPGQEILEGEFADDTRVLLKGSLNNLQRTEVAINTFCMASGARINWSKIMGFWIGQEEPPNCSPNAHFRWIPRGTPVRYLGSQVGIELSPTHQIAPLLLTIRKKTA